MKIIKEGENLGEQIFHCNNCSTEFLADVNEYSQELKNIEEEIGSKFEGWTARKVTYKCKPNFFLKAKCPFCSFYVSKNVLSNKPEYIYTAIVYGVT
jgi:hypothetical protein